MFNKVKKTEYYSLENIFDPQKLDETLISKILELNELRISSTLSENTDLLLSYYVQLLYIENKFKPISFTNGFCWNEVLGNDYAISSSLQFEKSSVLIKILFIILRNENITSKDQSLINLYKKCICIVEKILENVNESAFVKKKTFFPTNAKSLDLDANFLHFIKWYCNGRIHVLNKKDEEEVEFNEGIYHYKSHLFFLEASNFLKKFLLERYEDLNKKAIEVFESFYSKLMIIHNFGYLRAILIFVNTF